MVVFAVMMAVMIVTVMVMAVMVRVAGCGRRCQDGDFVAGRWTGTQRVER